MRGQGWLGWGLVFGPYAGATSAPIVRPPGERPEVLRRSATGTAAQPVRRRNNSPPAGSASPTPVDARDRRRRAGILTHRPHPGPQDLVNANNQTRAIPFACAARLPALPVRWARSP